MSVAIRRALFGKLAGDSTLTGLLGTPPTGHSQNIHYESVPPDVNVTDATYPYLIFQKQAGTPRYASQGSNGNQIDNEVWLIKAVNKGIDADKVDNIASRLDALLTDGTISISGKTQRLLRRESDVDYAEVRDGVLYRHSGIMVRLMYT